MFERMTLGEACPLIQYKIVFLLENQMKRLSIPLLIAAGAFAQSPAPPPAKSPAPAQPAAATPAREPGLYMIMNTSMGTITAQLFEKETPGTVANFVALARGTKAWKDPKTSTMVKRPYFNNLLFHRVIPGFMIQTGDATGTGAGDCGFTIKDETLPTLKYDRPGRLGLARLTERNTGACQFFITDEKYPSLDGEYTLFGQVVEGQDVVGKIARAPRDANDKPRMPVKLISVIIKREGPAPTPPAAAPKKSATPAKTGTVPSKTGMAPKKDSSPTKQ
jgi:peptidyl-prolyl cis-trans isomerase A (cyclophilin A)